MSKVRVCIVLEMKRDGRLPPLGKHQDHPPHDWWYTSWGGGHQLDDDWEPTQIFPDGSGYDTIERWVRRWHCPGRDA